ncbi:hypothetical protein [Vibrio crassostreae]|uniref:hypothetical protein n=1 Tax=Vibrio crassostreae TaxID=246167 RepID=UPI001B31312E|nr:hypothetical protein [Vibrio crassostreae]
MFVLSFRPEPDENLPNFTEKFGTYSEAYEVSSALLKLRQVCCKFGYGQLKHTYRRPVLTVTGSDGEAFKVPEYSYDFEYEMLAPSKALSETSTIYIVLGYKVLHSEKLLNNAPPEIKISVANIESVDTVRAVLDRYEGYITDNLSEFKLAIKEFSGEQRKRQTPIYLR